MAAFLSGRQDETKCLSPEEGSRMVRGLFLAPDWSQFTGASFEFEHFPSDSVRQRAHFQARRGL
jgi:hypothetical protein